MTQPAITKGVAAVLAALLFGFLASMALAQDLTIPKRGTDPVVLHVPNDMPDDGMLTVFLRGAEIPLAGRYSAAKDRLSFAPAFGFEPGQDYFAHVDSGGEEMQVAFRIPHTRQMSSAVVTDLYPSGDTLPENTLRFYIHFSVPMKPQVAFDYIRLRDASGKVDEAAFMRFKQELWNQDRTRLTVLIDPGRIKREVATNVELGPALRAGQRYTLSVEKGWPSADGTSVLPAFTKTFQVSDPLRSLPDTRNWSASAPCVGTRDALTVVFDRPFDRHLLMRSLRLQTRQGHMIEGQIAVETAEHAWRFTPSQPWSAEELRLGADTTLEDVTGNNFRDLLDHVAGQEEREMANSVLLIGTRNCTG